MMDPVTVISLCGVAYSVAKGAIVVGTALYKFKNDVNNFDNKSEAFVDEIQALGAACQVASQRLEAIVEDYSNTTDKNRSSTIHSEQLWTCLEKQITACQKTVQGLQKVLGDTHSAGVATTWKKVLKQLIVYLKVFDISEARERIKSHTTSLQIILLSVGIEISYFMPRTINQKLQTQLADQLTELTCMKDELSKLLNKRVKSFTGDDDDDDDNEAAILAASGQVIQSGKTLCSDSTVSGSTCGSLDPFKVPRVREWLADARSIENDQMAKTTRKNPTPALSSPKPADSIIDDFDSSNHLIDRADRDGQSCDILTEELDNDDDDDDDDSDVDVEVDLAIQGMDDGRAAFARKDYVSANAMLQEALKLVLELPISHRKVCDTDEVRYMLANCAFHLEDAASAKSALLAVLEFGSTSIPHSQGRIYDTSHMLSQACVRLGELEQARFNCRSALKGRQKLFSKSHESVYESTALMGRILELQGNMTRAGFCRTMIPDTHKHLIAHFKELNIEVLDQRHTPPNATKSLTQLPQQTSGQDRGPPQTPVEDESLRIGSVPRCDAPALSQAASLRSDIDNDFVTRDKNIGTGLTSSRSYKFRIPGLEDWADSRGYGEFGPWSLSQRKASLKEHQLIPESRIEKALAAADDEEALRLSRARSKLKPFLSHVRFGLIRELRLAVLFAVTPVVKVLIGKGVSLDGADSAGWTMLHYAVLSGSISTTELLLKEGASVSAAEQRGNMSPLSVALQRDYLDICDLLCHHKANPLREIHWRVGTPIHLACAKDILPLVRAWSYGKLEKITSAVHIVAPGLLNRDYRKLEADFSTSSIIEPRAVKRMTIAPIGVAALMGSIDVMNWAISEGMMSFELCRLGDTEYGASQPVSALALAAATGQTQMVRLLRNMEVNTGQTDNSAEALKMAVLNKMEDTACWLLNTGVRANEQIVSWAEKYDLRKFTDIANFDKETRFALNRRSSFFATA